MDAHNELTNRIITCFNLGDADQNRLYMLMNDYDVSKRSFEVGFLNTEYNTKLLDNFLATKVIKGCSERTIGAYHLQVKLFLIAVGIPATQVKASDIKCYLAKKQIVDGCSAVSRNNIYNALSSFYRWLYVEEYIDRNPFDKLETAKEPKVKKKAFTEREIELMRKAASTPRERCLIEVMLSTWCRVSEVSGMNISDINPNGSMVVLGKGNKERTVYLNEKAKMAIEEYLETRADDGDALFASGRMPYNRLADCAIQKVLKQIGDKAGVQNVHPHRFRRTGATFALRAGMPIETVSMILGHDSINTTQIYLDIDEQTNRNAHTKYSRI